MPKDVFSLGFTQWTWVERKQCIQIWITPLTTDTHTGILLKNGVVVNKGAVTKTYFWTGKPCSQQGKKKHLWPITQMLEPHFSLSPPLQPAVLKLSNRVSKEGWLLRLSRERDSLEDGLKTEYRGHVYVWVCVGGIKLTPRWGPGRCL